MTTIRDTEWEAPLLPARRDPEVAARIRKLRGRTGATLQFLDCPWAPEAIAHLSRGEFTRAFIDHDLADLAGLVVSRDNSCRYCFALQSVLLRSLGIPPQRIARLEQEFRTADLSPRERAALEFAQALSRWNPPPGRSELDALRRAGFEELAIVEFASIVAIMVFFNRISTLPALEPETYETLATSRFTGPLLRLAAPIISRVRRRGRLRPLEEGPKAGPFSYLVTAMDGLPIARELDWVLEHMWASPILPRRSKALVFAVVARAIGAQHAEAEAVSVLREAGLAADEIEAILDHLDGPGLDPVEKRIVPFTRETVWYEPAPLQRRARELQQALSPAQFAEFVVVASLANALARLDVIAPAGG